MTFDASLVFEFSTEVLFESKSRPLNYNMTFPLMNAILYYWIISSDW